MKCSPNFQNRKRDYTTHGWDFSLCKIMETEREFTGCQGSQDRLLASGSLSKAADGLWEALKVSQGFPGETLDGCPGYFGHTSSKVLSSPTLL
jgi:hypothetical protein